MLANINRLRKEREIQKVFKVGKSVRSANFSIRYAPNCLNNNRFAVVVGTKVDKRATRRNAIKRQVREVLRQIWSEIPGSYDYVISTHRLPSWPLKQVEIKEELAKLLILNSKPKAQISNIK